MDFKLDAFGTAASLAGVVMTLRRLYRLNFDTPAEIAGVLSDIDVNEQQALEQQALTQIATRAQARRSIPSSQRRAAD